MTPGGDSHAVINFEYRIPIVGPIPPARFFDRGLEIDVIPPVVNAPFRTYYAYNPLTVREYPQPAVVFDPSTFPNAATLQNAVASYGTAYPLFEQRGTFRFTIGRKF